MRIAGNFGSPAKFMKVGIAYVRVGKSALAIVASRMSVNRSPLDSRVSIGQTGVIPYTDVASGRLSDGVSGCGVFVAASAGEWMSAAAQAASGMGVMRSPLGSYETNWPS